MCVDEARIRLDLFEFRHTTTRRHEVWEHVLAFCYRLDDRLF
jgi:hypothetical protein